MKFIFMPGARLMLRLSNEKKLPLITALFLAPLAWLYHETGEHASSTLRLGLAFAVAFALYAMVAFYVQADLGWRVLIKAMERISQGDLTARVEGQLGGHFGVVMRMLQQINASLGGIVQQVRSSSRTVATSARDIANASKGMSERTKLQTETLEKTASAMEELSATVKHNADNCRVASLQARSATEIARSGAQTVHTVVEAMGEIDKSYKRIAEIVGVIEGIAFQTNILALNAAVEAARAGEEGRGFAVVAGEVRALAQRSAEAATEVRRLIAHSVSQVEAGSRKAGDAGRAIDEIVASVDRANAVVGEIAEASAEQSAGVNQINRATAQLESVTQHNAEMVQEAGARIAAFLEEADRLTQLVERFKLDDQTGDEPASARRAPVASRQLLPRSS